MDRKTSDTVSLLVDSMRQLPGVNAIILFGSHAKGKAKPMSDIDICVVTDSSANEHNVAAHSSRNIQTVVFSSLPPFVQYEVMKDGKVLFCRDRIKLRDAFLAAIREYHFHVPMYERFKVSARES